MTPDITQFMLLTPLPLCLAFLVDSGYGRGFIYRWAAIQVLAKNWPDEVTRELLAERSIRDDHFDARSTALKALAENWPDERTRKLIEERAIHDGDRDARSVLLEALAENWPDERTRKLLEKLAVTDEHNLVRVVAKRLEKSLRKKLGGKEEG